jgi:SAM-dependent methyltransferase
MGDHPAFPVDPPWSRVEAAGVSFHRPASAYDRYMGRYGATLASAFVDVVDPGRDDRVLDVGCGPGALTTELVSRLGAGRVSAVDPSPSFAEACAHRLPGVDVRVAQAEALPFADHSFDVVCSQLVLNFLTDRAAGVAQMTRVARPGGTVAAAVWDYAGEMTLLRRFWAAAVALDPSAADHDEGSRRGVCAPGPLRDLWTSAGLTDVRTGSVLAHASYASFDDLWSGFEGGVGPAGAWVVGRDPEGREALRTELRSRLGAGDAPFELPARAWTVVGRVACAKIAPDG